VWYTYARMTSPRGLSMVNVVLISLVFLAVIFFGLRVIGSERAKARDAQRVADMARLQVAFLLLYNRTSSYAGAAENGCNQVHAPARTCNLKEEFSSIATLRDPRGGDYLVTKVPDASGYEVSFSLEQGATGLAAGKHILTPAGIQ